MRFLRYFLYAVFLTAALSAGLWIFAPWNECAMLALSAARLEAARGGFYVTYGGMERKGLFPPSYHFKEVDVEGPMIKATFSDFIVKLKPVSSIFTLSASFHAGFGGAAVRYIPDNGFVMGRGKMNVAAGNGVIAVSDVDVEGDITLTGDMVFDVEARSITESTVILGASQEIGVILGSPMMSGFFESVSPGKWRIKENAFGNR
jgi:hypothetical protein